MLHWTEELFKSTPELFVGAFKERQALAPGETDVLLAHLKEHGFHPKRVLDLNCGIGRHSMELGKRGISVLGTDLSPSYIEMAEQRAREEKLAAKVSFRVADMREITSVLSGEQPFDGIINLWTSFGFYDDKTNDDILRQCLELVRPGGFFAMDIANRDWLIRNFSRQGFQRIGDRIILEERELNLRDSRMYNTWTYLKAAGEDTYIVEKAVKIDHRVWSLHEFIELFERTGWKFKGVYPGISTMPQTTGDTLSLGEVLRAQRLLIISSRPEAK